MRAVGGAAGKPPGTCSRGGGTLRLRPVRPHAPTTPVAQKKQSAWVPSAPAPAAAADAAAQVHGSGDLKGQRLLPRRHQSRRHELLGA